MDSEGYTNDQLLKWTRDAALIDGFATCGGGRYEIWRAGSKHVLSREEARRMLIELLATVGTNRSPRVPKRR